MLKEYDDANEVDKDIDKMIIKQGDLNYFVDQYYFYHWKCFSCIWFGPKCKKFGVSQV